MTNKKLKLNAPKSGKSGTCGGCVFKILIFAILVYILQAVFVFNNFFSLNKNLVGNIFICTLSLLAFISIWVVYKIFPHNFPYEKKGKLFLMISMGLFFLGDLLWLINEMFLKKLVPIGSYPDFVWSFAYLALMVALIYLIKTEFMPSRFLPILIILVGFVLGCIFLAGDISEDLELNSFNLPHFMQDVYPFYDFIILGLVTVLLWPLIVARSSLFLGWIILGIGTIIRLIYDIIFIDMTETNSYSTGNPIDLLYVIFYLAIIVQSFIKYRSFKK